MRTQISAVAILRGKVIDGTYHSVAVNLVTDTAIGGTIRRSMELARAMGWHLSDLETWVRVEFRSVE